MVEMLSFRDVAPAATLPNQAMSKDTTTSPKASGLKSPVYETQGRNLNQKAVPNGVYQKAVDKTIPGAATANRRRRN
jgi:hypothetical protein